MSDLPATLTPRSLHELERRIIALIDEFAAADADDPDARRCCCIYGGFPRIDPPGWTDVAESNGRRAERRYALLVFLFWLPTGLYVATKVLLMLDRGLSVDRHRHGRAGLLADHRGA